MKKVFVVGSRINGVVKVKINYDAKGGANGKT
jgi:hypothetical protein